MGYKLIVCAFLIIFVACGLGWHDYRRAINSPAVIGKSIFIEIEKGDSLNRVIDKLLTQKVDINPFWFKVVAVQENAVTQLKAGEYELVPGLTMFEILSKFVQGKTRQYAITFPEGWSFKEMLQEIEKNPNIEHTLHEADFETIMLQVGADIKHPEGVFFPDTYFFEKHTADVALLTRAFNKMQLVLKQEWQHKAEALPFKTPYEALILASIVEKETRVVAERSLIAGVFIRRLQKDMMLQTDPTVIYGMGEHYHGNISSADLKSVTPYNTYVIYGLPPTPIALPGLDAIHAALHPDNSNALYFVARGDGTHEFSTTLKDHNLAVNRFQKKVK